MIDEEPDYRFSLANERTYLAWIRTGLALIAGGVAIRIFIDDLNFGWLSHVAAVGPAALGGLLSVTAYRHWLRVQDAMRAGAPLPSQRGPLVLTVGIVVLAAVVSVGLLL